MKIIFLDFDGVLNSASYCRLHREPGVLLDPTRMALLRRIIETTGAEIVLSTSWKEHWEATGFVVLDDMPMDEEALKNHCVLTARLRDGLDEEDTERAIRILTD